MAGLSVMAIRREGLSDGRTECDGYQKGGTI